MWNGPPCSKIFHNFFFILQKNIRSPASDAIAPSFRGNLSWHSKIILVPNIAAKNIAAKKLQLKIFQLKLLQLKILG